MNALCRMLISTGVLLACVPALAAEPELKKLRFAATARVGAVDVGAPAQFELACHGAKDGALSLALILSSPDAIKTFPLAAFEGPDGIGESKDLARWGVDTRGDAVQASGSIGGWYGVDGDGFLLSRSERAHRASALATLVAALGRPEAKRLRLSVASPEGGDALQAEALLDGRQADIAATAKACLP